MPERYVRNDTIISDKEKFLSRAINQAALEIGLSQPYVCRNEYITMKNKINKDSCGTTQSNLKSTRE